MNTAVGLAVILCSAVATVFGAGMARAAPRRDTPRSPAGGVALTALGIACLLAGLGILVATRLNSLTSLAGTS